MPCEARYRPAAGRVLVVDPSVPMKREIDEVLHRKAKLFEDDIPAGPQGMNNRVIFAPPRSALAKMTRTGNNGLMAAFMLAYNRHLRLRLSPDVLWIAILQAVSAWVNGTPERAEKYRDVFVKHLGVMSLDVIVGFEVDWALVLHRLRDMAEANVTPGILAAFAPQFSITTSTFVTACAITAMHAVKEFFKYSMTTMCGIGEVVLEGNAADWVTLRARAVNLQLVLGKIGDILAPWFARLDGTLAELEATAVGRPPRAEFWSYAYSHLEPYGFGSEEQLTGWFLHFFCASETPLERVPLSKLPSGYVTVPFSWNKIDGMTEFTLLCSGMWKTHVDGDGAVFCEPQWAVLSA